MSGGSPQTDWIRSLPTCPQACISGPCPFPCLFILYCSYCISWLHLSFGSFAKSFGPTAIFRQSLGICNPCPHFFLEHCCPSSYTSSSYGLRLFGKKSLRSGYIETDRWCVMYDRRCGSVGVASPAAKFLLSALRLKAGSEACCGQPAHRDQ